MKIKTIFYAVRRTVIRFSDDTKNLNFLTHDPKAGEMYEELESFFLYSEYDSSLRVIDTETDPYHNPNFMFHGKTRINLHADHSSETDHMFIGEMLFEKFCSSPQKWIKSIMIMDNKTLKSRSRRRIKHIVKEIGKTFEENLSMTPLLLKDKDDQSAFETLLAQITKRLDNAESKIEKFILFCFTVLCFRQIIAANVPLVLEGMCFEMLDRKARHNLCGIFSKYVEQTIICISEAIVNMPIDDGSKKLLSQMPQCAVYEIIG